MEITNVNAQKLKLILFSESLVCTYRLIKIVLEKAAIF